MPAPDLLNPDGTVSKATVFMMSHSGLRRDAARLVRLAREAPSRADDLREAWKGFHEVLHGHHEAVDTRMLPGLRGVGVLSPGAIRGGSRGRGRGFARSGSARCTTAGRRA